MRSCDRRHSPLTIGLAALLVVGLTACDDDDGGTTTDPDPIARADVVGSYEATTFSATTNGVTTDLLADGAELTITLSADGRTTGRLLVPGGDEGGSDLDADLSGTWTFDDDAEEIEFDQAADTFIRDVVFLAQRAGGTVRLRAEDTFGPTTIEVVLER